MSNEVENETSIIEESKKYALNLMNIESQSPEMVAAIAELLKVLRDWY